MIGTGPNWESVSVISANVIGAAVGVSRYVRSYIKSSRETQELSVKREITGHFQTLSDHLTRQDGSIQIQNDKLDNALQRITVTETKLSTVEQEITLLRRVKGSRDE